MPESHKQSSHNEAGPSPLDISELLSTEEHIVSYIESVAQENDWAFLLRAIGHSAKSMAMSRLATELGLDRATLYKFGIPKTIPIQAILHALLPAGYSLKPKRLPRIEKIVSRDDYSILLTYDDGIVGSFDLTSYLDMEVFIELKDLSYFHRVENHGHFIEWPNGQDLCAGSIYHSMVRLEKMQEDFVGEDEMAEIEGNLSLNQSMQRGIQDALAGRGYFLYSPDHDLQYDDEELDLLEVYHARNLPKDAQESFELEAGEFLGFSEILTDTIAAVSEKEFCAGWRNEIEYDIWDLVHSGPQRNDYFSLTKAQCMHFKMLAQLSKGWIHYGEKEKKWVPMKEWLSLFATWKSRKLRG